MTTSFLKLVAAATVALGGALAAAPASAAPMLDSGLATQATPEAAAPEAVRLVCGPYGCFYRPGPRYFYGPRYYRPRYFGPRFYGPRPFYGGPRFYGPRFF